MKRLLQLFLCLFLVPGALALAGPAYAAVQGSPTPAAAPACMVGVGIQPLGQGMPADVGGRALIVARLTIAPEGGFDAHTHPGILTVTVDAGSLGFTMLDEGEMTLNRADGTSETIAPNEEVLMNQGDWLVEEGMVHMAWNRSDKPTVVIISGLVDPSKPLVQCVE